jgi:hypothetical protein
MFYNKEEKIAGGETCTFICRFREMLYLRALETVSMPLAASLVKDDGKEIFWPGLKYVIVNRAVASRPRRLPFVETPIGYVVNSMKLSISFQRTTLFLLIPSVDWRCKPENNSIAQRIERLDVEMYDTDGPMWTLRLDFLNSAHVGQKINLFGDIAERLGLERETFDLMVKSVIKTMLKLNPHTVMRPEAKEEFLLLLNGSWFPVIICWWQ